MALAALMEAKPGEIKGPFSSLSLYIMNCKGPFFSSPHPNVLDTLAPV